MVAEMKHLGSDIWFNVFFFTAYVFTYLEETKFYSPLEEVMTGNI